MKTLKQQIVEYLEAQKPFYGDKEMDDNLKVIKNQKEDLSTIDELSKILILRFIDDNELYFAIESATI
ncbi:hypothetical protein K8354_13005 [Polaribacter litorisediminis]|uniref:hypothetical protein n=1 Tax=Polaribacter litorisediminis TaxID=1908341 RepID=UPI001CC11C43|nr:hypothetical protein [Polaribacter litorisediminis]UAM97231.1 hypothetical protein K8354_13005 [Polaribacter litorisediminis]